MFRVIPILALVVWWCGTGPGCTAHVFSPPAQGAPGDIAATTPQDQHNLRISGLTYDALTGLPATGFDLRYAYGLLEELDLLTDVMLLRITEDAAADPHNNLYTARVGLRYAPAFFEDHVALVGGLGGGGSTLGGFLSPDIGLSLALDNPYIVPFAQGTFFVSLPLDARSVDISPLGSPLGSRVQTPQTTLGWHAAVGLKLYIGNRSGAVHGAFSLAATVTYLNDGDADTSILGISPGMEIGF